VIEPEVGTIYDFAIQKSSEVEIMRLSDIIIPKSEDKVSNPRTEKLVNAYKFERTQQEITEVELNRTKIVMIDENGNMKRVPILSEH